MGLTRKQWLTLVVIVLGTFVTVLNQTLITPALPAVMEEMSIDAATAQWLTTGFTLVNAIMIPITAYLQDRFSVKGLFIFSLSVFAIGTLMAGWGPNFPMLLGGRLVQACGAGILMPLSMTVLLVMFPIERRGTAMGVFGLIIAFAPAIGPTISGIIVDTANWHIMFYGIAILVIIVVILAAVLMQSQVHDTDGKATLDVPSVILSTLGFGGLLYGFSVVGSYGIDFVSAAAMIVGAVCVVLFFIRQTKLAEPMLRVKILLNKNFLMATIICMLVQAALLAAPVIMPIYIQNILGYSATITGLAIMPGAIIMGIMNPIAGRIFDKYGARAMGITGMVLLTIASVGFCFLTADTSIVYVTVLYAIRMFAMALVNMPITTWGMNALNTNLMNHGTSINNTLRQVAGSLGAAIVVSVYTLVSAYNAQSMGQTEAAIFGINIAFAVCVVMVVIGLVLTIIFVRGKAGTAEALGDEGDEKDILRQTKNRFVIASIMKDQVYAVKDTDSVKSVMELFIYRGISACPVVNKEGTPVGFISDGDILKFLARQNESFIDPVVMIATTIEDEGKYDEKLDYVMGLPVSAICTKNVISVSSTTEITEVCRVLAKYHLKKVPVMDGGKLVGVINRSDITRYSMEAYLEGHGDEAVLCESDEDACLVGDEEVVDKDSEETSANTANVDSGK